MPRSESKLPLAVGASRLPQGLVTITRPEMDSPLISSSPPSYGKRHGRDHELLGCPRPEAKGRGKSKANGLKD